MENTIFRKTALRIKKSRPKGRFFNGGEYRTRTYASQSGWQISNLLHYHSANSPQVRFYMYNIFSAPSIPFLFFYSQIPFCCLQITIPVDNHLSKTLYFLQKQIIKYIIYENAKIIDCTDTCFGNCLLFLLILPSGLHAAFAQILLLYCWRFGQVRACSASELCNDRTFTVSKTSIRKNRMAEQYHLSQQHYTRCGHPVQLAWLKKTLACHHDLREFHKFNAKQC